MSSRVWQFLGIGLILGAAYRSHLHDYPVFCGVLIAIAMAYAIWVGTKDGKAEQSAD